MTKVALYIRVSTNEQVLSGYSFNEQRDVLLSYCRERKWEVFKVYADAGLSGKNIKRPGIQNLIKDSENKKFEVVLFWRLDRLARNTLETLKLVHENFLENGIEVASMRENFDTTTDFGRFILTLFAAQAERELATTRERMSLGRYGRVKSGKALVGGTRPFGYNYSTQTGLLSVNEAEAKIVKQIYRDFLKGMSLNKIRAKLNHAGHLEKEKNWHVSMVRAVLTNPIYYGVVKIKGLTFDGLHEALISKAVFNKAQRLLVENREKNAVRNNNKLPFQVKYMLSGRLKCGYCHST